MTKQENSGVRAVGRDGHIEVSRLPRRPENGGRYWINTPNGRADLSHGLFKFPAKFHVPVVQWALGTFGRRGSKVLDPFTGSGTVQVEAMRRGIRSLGIDVDPLSVFVTRTKTTPIRPAKMWAVEGRLSERVEQLRRLRGGVQDDEGADISVEEYEQQVGDVRIPDVPNIEHWFRRYVIVDLARLRDLLVDAHEDERIVRLLLTTFASIIRKVSNADPAPVSGLEVTKVQKEKNKRLAISVFDSYLTKLRGDIGRMEKLWNDLEAKETIGPATVYEGDARNLESMCGNEEKCFPVVLTSPPYCRSVEYSRRHRLELFWLDFVESAEDHTRLKHEYVGRDYVRVDDWEADEEFGVSELDEALNRIRRKNGHHYRTVHHYFSNMNEIFKQMKRVMKAGGTLVVVVGNSICSGVAINTADYLVELLSDYFEFDYRFSYAIQNHYMHYGLWNDAGIKEEHVLVLKAP